MRMLQQPMIEAITTTVDDKAVTTENGTHYNKIIKVCYF